MTQSDYAATDGASLIWPEINSHFLSLRGIPEHLQADTPIRATYRRLLVGFDAITSCELKDLYKFTLCLQQLAPEEADCPELRLLVAAFRAWVSFDYPERACCSASIWTSTPATSWRCSSPTCSTSAPATRRN